VLHQLVQARHPTHPTCIRVGTLGRSRALGYYPAIIQTEFLHETIRRIWGYDRFLPLQEDAIACVLDQRDSLVVLPTGGGKSL
jgi:superfamily II DNA helicase RecQ